MGRASWRRAGRDLTIEEPLLVESLKHTGPDGLATVHRSHPPIKNVLHNRCGLPVPEKQDVLSIRRPDRKASCCKVWLQLPWRTPTRRHDVSFGVTGGPNVTARCADPIGDFLAIRRKSWPAPLLG